MSDAVITVEKLGKKYSLRHEGSGPRYTALRDVLSSRIKALFHRGQSSPSSTEREDFWALNDVSFEVKKGEVLGIIGRNGAGKSTLLKILSRITEPTRGRVTLRGRVASLLEVGTGFHPELTGRENIYLNGSILGMTRAEIRTKFDEIVEFAGVARFLDTQVKHFSSGMYVRLAFAVAAHLEPEVLVVDEVLAVGDTEFQKRCLGKMKDVAGSGRTVLLVSHQLGHLRRLCTQGIVMEQGQARVFSNMESALHYYVEGGKSAGGTSFQSCTHIADAEFTGSADSTSNVYFGDPLSVCIKLKNLPQHPLGVTVAFKDSLGARLTLLSTNPHDGIVLPSVPSMTVRFDMPFCCFAPGEYFVDVAVTEPNVRNVEEVQNALQIEVLPSSIGGVLPYDTQYGTFFPQHSWRVDL